MIAAFIFLIFLLAAVTIFACIQVTHAHNRRLKEMDHRHYLEKSNHQQMIENEKKRNR